MNQNMADKDINLNKESDLALIEVVARSLHDVFENFQYEVNTNLIGKSEQIISKSLEDYIKSVRDVFVESFHNLGNYVEKKDLNSSFDMFYFSAYIVDLFYVVYYSKYDNLSINLFKWYTKYGMRDTVSNIIKELTELTDKYLDMQESCELLDNMKSKVEFTQVQDNLGKILTRVLLLNETELYNSSVWNIFPNNKYIMNLTNLLSHNSKELNSNNRRLSEGLINLKDKLPLVVQISIEGLLGNGNIIQSCSNSWLEAFIFSFMYVPGINLENFTQFLSVYLECVELGKAQEKIYEKEDKVHYKRIVGSIINGKSHEMLEHEVGVLHLLSKNMSEFVSHIYDSPQLYGPFLAAHLFDILFYEGFLENVSLEYKSKNLRSSVIMNYTRWLIETDLCDPAIYLQECIDLEEFMDDALTTLSLLANKIPLLYEQISDNTQFDLDVGIFLIRDNKSESRDINSINENIENENCRNCIFSNLKFDWTIDESISVFIKFIREFIPQIILDETYKLDFSRKLIIERYNQINLEFKISLNKIEYKINDCNFSFITYKSILLYLEKIILLMELSNLDNNNNKHFNTKNESYNKNNYMVWLALEHFLNVPPCHFLKLNSCSKYKTSDNIDSIDDDLFSIYKFQSNIPEEYNILNNNSTEYNSLSLSINVPIDKQIKFLLEFFSQNGIIEEIIHLFPLLYGDRSKDINKNNNDSENIIEFPPFLNTIICFSKQVEPVFSLIYKPVWNSDTNVWESPYTDKTKDKLIKIYNFLKNSFCNKCLLGDSYNPTTNNYDTNENFLNLILESSIESLISINPNSVPNTIISLYCLYCLKLVDEYNNFNESDNIKICDLPLNDINDIDVISSIYKNWIDIFFAHTTSDITHPFISDSNLKNLLVSKIYDGIERYRYSF
ncbi:hypothetical protein FG386_001892 [Cryptosporidium ryanae]|uniref:uncharacterized protein n=1 Tax=Cryptosporidium ryanae TaxID=515981 RepID=UPI00351A4E54|nr:hypothetical protein FG386_001892 [Cryptosporidium ryanae]